MALFYSFRTHHTFLQNPDTCLGLGKCINYAIMCAVAW